MARRLFSRDPLTGLTTYFHDSHDAKTFTLETVQDVTEILDDNKRDFFGESSKGRNWRGELHQVASIPNTVYLDLERRGIIADQKKFRQWLNDRDNMYYRTKGGRV